REPRGAPSVVDGVPQPACAGDFVLPLLHPHAVDLAPPQLASKWVLSIGPGPRVRSNRSPCLVGWPGSLLAEILPAFDCILGVIPERPTTGRRRWGYAFLPLRRHVSGAVACGPLFAVGAGGPVRPSAPAAGAGARRRVSGRSRPRRSPSTRG